MGERAFLRVGVGVFEGRRLRVENRGSRGPLAFGAAHISAGPAAALRPLQLSDVAGGVNIFRGVTVDMLTEHGVGGVVCTSISNDHGS